MISPLEIVNLLGDFISYVADAVSSSSERNEVLTHLMWALIGVSPTVAVGLAIDRYAKNHGRDISAGRRSMRLGAPFADPRLNEVIDVMRRFTPAAFIVGIVLAALIAGAIDNENASLAIAAGVGVALGSARQLFVNACLAFGAEPAPAFVPVAEAK